MILALRVVLGALLAAAALADCSPNYEYADAASGGCLPCEYNCATCFDAQYCLECVQEYFLADSTCLKCSFGCAVCTTADVCTTCNSGLYLTSSGTCAACGTGVATCTIAVIQSCQDTYFLLSTICAGCLANCNSCADFVTCATCALGYYLAPSGSACLACPTNCLICTAADACTACQQGYTQSSGLCSPFSCATLDPFCIACTDSQCLTCRQGKYLNTANTCSQTASLLCLESTGPYHTTCQTSNYGCPSYADVQTDSSGSQLPVCLPKSATKTQEFIYLENAGYSCSGSCSQASTAQLTYSTSQAYYSVNYYLSVRFFGTANTRTLTLSFLNQNATPTANASHSVDVSKELSAFSDTDTDCLGCRYAQTVVSGSLLLSQGGYDTVVSFSEGSGQFQIMEAMFEHGICQVSFCSSCSSAIDCYACFEPYFLELTSCVSSCDSGFYVYGRVCYLQCPVGSFTVSSTYSCSACVSPCLTCSDADSCLTCVAGYFLEGSACRTACSSAFLFANSTSGHCETCPNPCVTCSYQNSSMRCLSCAAGYLFNGSTCVFLCPWGEYGLFVSGTSACAACTPSCSSCYISSSICSSCAAGYLLLGSDCLSLSACPAAYFANSTYNQCVPCHYPCATCAAGQADCTSCLRGSLFGNSCLNQCPSGYFSSFANPQNISCVACSAPCLACISATECISCTAGNYLSGSACVTVCPTDFYPEISNLSCVECVPPCKSCLNASACLSCTTGYLDNTTCTLQCNSSAYVASNFSCTLCPSPCLSCYAADYCLACQLPYLLQSHSCITLAQCNNLTGFYPNYSPNATLPVSAACSSCAFPCFGCINNSVTCASCQGSYYFVPTLYKCVTACPSAYFLSTADCLPCSVNCYQCLGIAGNCTSCSAGMYLDSVSQVCVGVCPSQYYPNDQSQSCSPCSSPCLSCYNVYLCSSCQTGILYEKQCISSCPSQTFLNASANTCISCTNSCLTCLDSTTCLSCASGHFLYLQQCLSACPSLYYSNEFTRACQACSVPCGNCTSATSCITCVTGYYFFNTLCVSSCSASYYADNSTSQCLSCNLTICLTCAGGPNACLTCNINNGFYLQQQQCVSSCSLGSFADQVGGSCAACPFPCSACLNYTHCSACLPSYLLFTSRCFSQCPIAYYADNSSACQPCTPDCEICSSSTVCLECKSGLYILNSTCVSACPLSYYQGLAAITNYDCCLPCQSDCLNCSSAEYCLTCRSGFMQFNGLCLSSCPILYYAVNGSSSFCLQCSQYCTSCLNSSYCLNCIGSFLYQHACVTTCPPQTYASQGSSCQPCRAPCFNCSGDYTCLSCLAGYIYFHDYCVSSCPSDVWYYPSNNSCSANCPYNKHAATMTCYVGICGPKLVTLNGYCLEQCSANYFVNAQQECTLCSQDPTQCKNLFSADLQVLYVDALTLVLYYNQRAAIANISDISVSFVDVNGNALLKNYSSFEITEYKVAIKYDYSAVSLVNITLTLPYVRSQETPQCIANNQYKRELKAYRDYSSQPRPQWIPVVPMLLTGVLLVAVAVNVVNRASHFVQLLDFVQIVGVTLYLDVQFPPLLEDFLAGFRGALFVLSENMVNLLPYSFSPPKFIYYNTDTSIFRNSILLLIAFLAILLFFLVVIAVNAYNKERLVKAVRVIRYRLLNDLFSICLTPLLLFACQILHQKPAAIFVTALLAAAGLGYVVWISYKIVQVRKLSELEGLLGEFEKTESKLGLMYIPFGYVRRITLTLGLGVAPFSPISTLTLLLVTTFLIMVCVYFYEPFDNHYTDYVTIFMECSLTLYVLCLVVLALQSLPVQATFALAAFVVALLVLTFLVCLGWLVYLTVSDIRTKGCWPSLKQQQQDDAEDDYGDSKSEKMRKQQEKEKEDERRRKLGLPLEPGKVQPVKDELPVHEESANEFLNRFQSRSDELFSGNWNNEEFKHWSSEEGSQKEEAAGRELPSLLVKKQIGGGGS